MAEKLRIIVDDVAAINGHASDSVPPGAAVLSLSEPGILNDLRNPAAALSDGGRTAIVTADARLAAEAQGARRVADVRLAATLVDDPDAVFQFFVLSVPPDEITEALAAIDLDTVVPVHVCASDVYRIVVIAEASTLRRLSDSSWNPVPIGAPGLPDTHDLYLLRDVAAGDGAEARVAAHDGALLYHLDEGVIIAIPATASIEDFHFPVTMHGHNRKLLPDRALLRNGTAAATTAHVAQLQPATQHAERLRQLIPEARMTELVAQLSGRAPTGAGLITSRHIHHGDATRAVEVLSAEFRELGLDPRRHRFVHEGVVHENVYADIAGTGDEMIWVTAHLDSTAAREPAYRPGRDPAPGADDDGSGSAAVVAIAAALTALAESARPVRTVRFALFNAEEHGLIGSGYFARAAAEAGLRIDAVLQLDMIGFVPRGDDRRFEVHYGNRTDPAVERTSEPVARLIAAAAELFAGVGDAELYHSPTDPADGRSDHTSFQDRGYPAVLVSENFFGGTVGQPDGTSNNPNYHLADDTEIDATYATAIARAAALSAWTLATA